MRRAAVLLALSFGCATPKHDLAVQNVPAAPSYDGRPLVALDGDGFADPDASEAERSMASKALSEARGAVAEALGTLEGEKPLAMFCRTEACGLYFAGSSLRSASFGKGARASGGTFVFTRPTVVVLRMDEGTKRFTLHELVHSEVFARTRDRAMPGWFHEGLAAYLSNQPPCKGPERRGIDRLRRLEAYPAWGSYTNWRGTQEDTYCQAKREIAAWVEQHGQKGLVTLLEAVRHGTSFDEAYGPLLTDPPGEPRTVLMTGSTDLGDPKKPFTLALWVKPEAASGVLANLSETPVGTGWCSSLLGFDAQGRPVAQVLHAGHPEVSNFTVAAAEKPLPLGTWSHVAMSWAPGSAARLYVNGAVVAETKAQGFYANGPGSTMYVTWGSLNLGGAGYCWTGAVTPSDFRGQLSGMRLFDAELSPGRIAELAKNAP